MWTGRTWPRDHRWYDPNSYLIGPEYTLRALGTIYVVSARVLSGFVHPKIRNMRLSGSTEGGGGAGGDTGCGALGLPRRGRAGGLRSRDRRRERAAKDVWIT